MSEFDKWFEGEMPNSHKKVNKERIETVIYSCAEASWDHQQANIDAITKQRDSFIKAHHIAMNDVCEHKAKIDELQKQVITQGQNFNDQAQKLKDTEYFNQKLQARINEALRHVVDHGGYDDLTHVINILKGNKDEN